MEIYVSYKIITVMDFTERMLEDMSDVNGTGVKVGDNQL